MQIEYYKQHSLDLLRSTHRVMPSSLRSLDVLIYHVAGRYVQPITGVLSISPAQDLFISLLDKFQMGLPLAKRRSR